MSFDQFVQQLKLKSRSTVDEVRTLLKNFTSNIKPLETSIVNMIVSLDTHGFIRINDLTIGQLNKLLREGDLKQIASMSFKDSEFTDKDLEDFNAMTAHFPENKYYHVTKAINENVKISPQYNITETSFDNLSNELLEELSKIERSLLEHFKLGEIIILNAGSLTVTDQWLFDGTRKRKGCYMFTNIDGKISSCKVSSFTCAGIKTDESTCKDVTNLNYRNTVLELIAIAAAEDTNPLKIEVAKIGNVSVDEVQQFLDIIIDEQFNELYTLLQDSRDNIPEFEICVIKNTNIENGVVPTCRLCSPDAKPLTTAYLDPNQYDENVTFQCINDPSLLDLISDIEFSTKLTLLPKSSSIQKSKINYIVWVVCAIVVLIVVIVLVIIMKTSASITYYPL
ncbi:ODV-E56-2 [Drosophila innubila nudivirus]|uniref:ODV-E56-2 n=1 Tax=Drosophila innubila nudivirus TaxID=2057187 RepID=A0A2H4UX42_9VIRU|nr:ODV-E56-2 [Drosophila innubila nudivirus]ATZ81487.1 ODV-E56-2 [Drosophila innubila nudivirus]